LASTTIFCPSFFTHNIGLTYFGANILQSTTSGFSNVTAVAPLITNAYNLLAARFNPSLSELPATYHIFNLQNPEVLVFMFTYGVNQTQWIIAGNLEKIHNSAYVGGAYMSGSSSVSVSNTRGLQPLAETSYKCRATAGAQNGLFFGTGLNDGAACGFIHVEMDGGVPLKRGITDSGLNAIAGSIAVGQTSARRLFRGLNTWNSQAILIPVELYYINSISHFKYLGHTEHIRFVRIDNYNSNDSIVLGSDTWRVFPMISKNVAERNGASGAGSTNSGTLGLAIRYVP
jgi:hypothetical protein